MKKDIQKTGNLILILLFVFTAISSEISNAQNTFTLNLKDTSTYQTTCGKVISSQWSVKNDSCLLYTPYFRKETAGCQNDSYDFKINQSGNGDASDVAYVQYELNGTWVTDTVLHASAYSAVHQLTGTIQVCYGDVIRIRIILGPD